MEKARRARFGWLGVALAAMPSITKGAGWLLDAIGRAQTAKDVGEAVAGQSAMSGFGVADVVALLGLALATWAWWPKISAYFHKADELDELLAAMSRVPVSINLTDVIPLSVAFAELRHRLEGGMTEREWRTTVLNAYVGHDAAERARVDRAREETFHDLALNGLIARLDGRPDSYTLTDKGRDACRRILADCG